MKNFEKILKINVLRSTVQLFDDTPVKQNLSNVAIPADPGLLWFLRRGYIP